MQNINTPKNQFAKTNREQLNHWLKFILFMLISCAMNLETKAQECATHTGRYLHTFDNGTWGLYVNFGISIEMDDPIEYNSSKFYSTFRHCSGIDKTVIFYNGKEYTIASHPEVFQSFNPSFNWVSYVYSVNYAPMDKIFQISNPVCTNGYNIRENFMSRAEFDAIKKNNPKFRAHRNNFLIYGLKIYDMAVEGMGDALEIIKKLEQADKMYAKASEEYNSQRYEEALNTINYAERMGQGSPKMTELKKKVEDALKNAKASETKKQLDDIFQSAQTKFNNKDYSGASADVEKGMAILKEEGMTDSRFEQLQQKIATAKETEAKEAAAKKEEEKKDGEQSDSTSNSGSDSDGSNSSSEGQTSTSQQDDGNSAPSEPDPEEEARKAEQARLERQAAYYEERSQQQAENTAAAAEIGVAMLMVHYYLGTLIYGGFDELPGNMVSAPGPSVEFIMGYSMSWLPLFINVSEEEFDGNQYTYDNYSEARNMCSFNMNLGISLWHVKSKNFGLGYQGMVTAGHGLYLHNFHLNGVVGMKGYAGTEHLRLYSEYNAGFRSASFNDWVTAGKTQIGKVNTTYHQLKLGVRISDEVDWNGPTQLNVDILPIFEAHHKPNPLQFGSDPIGWYWNHGIELAARIDSRLSFVIQAMYEYPIMGENLYGFKSSSVENKGTYFSLGVLRNIEFYANHGTSTSDIPEGKERAQSKKFTELVILSPTIEYLTPGRKIVNGKIALTSINLFSVLANSPLHEHLALCWGGGIGYRGLHYTVRQNANLTNGAANGYSYKSEGLVVSVPLGFKIHHNFDQLNKYWILGGLEARYTALKNNKSKDPGAEEWKTTEDYHDLNANGMYTNLGFGVNYYIAGQAFSTGLVYRRATKHFFAEDIARIQGVEFRWALIL